MFSILELNQILQKIKNHFKNMRYFFKRMFNHMTCVGVLFLWYQISRYQCLLLATRCLHFSGRLIFFTTRWTPFLKARNRNISGQSFCIYRFWSRKQTRSGSKGIESKKITWQNIVSRQKLEPRIIRGVVCQE